MVTYSITLVADVAGDSNVPPCANTPRVGDARPFAPLLAASASPKLNSNYELDFSSFTWPTEPS